MPYEYEISIGERAWESVYIHDYTYVWNRAVKRRKLLGDVKEEELVEAEINEKDYQMIVFESPMLEFINEQHYHGLAQTGDMETPAKLKKGMSGIATCYEKELF